MILIVMGVSGCGKTTVGQLLAKKRNLPFYDADDFHFPESIKKMEGGNALTDADRMPWLLQLAENIRKWERDGGAVLACSALKETYRKVLWSVPRVVWIYLDGPAALILQRLQSRKAHFMSPALLNSQYQALEKPDYGLHADITLHPEEIVRQINLKLDNMISNSEFGLIGLGVMGKSLALNLAEKGVQVSIYNRHVPGKEEGVAKKIIDENIGVVNLKGFDQLADFVQSLEKPRKILLMIFAGGIDSQIEELLPLLEAGDVLIDGGNSFYKDTARREELLRSRSIHFVGAGISGGEEGARRGPSIMPGGARDGYLLIEKYLNLISAKDKSGESCSAYIGPDGAGHFVKMVHNGIEYAEMQALAEVYYLMRFYLDYSNVEIAAIMNSWQDTDVAGYLLEITIDILQKKEGDDFLLDLILDQAEQKGTGGLSVSAALEYGVPYSSLAEAVMARSLSAMKKQRIKASSLYQHRTNSLNIDKEAFLSKLKNAYQATRIINHEIGFNLMREVSLQKNWNLDFSEIARIWTNGCIIRSVFMEDLADLLKNNTHILTSQSIIGNMEIWQKDLAYCVAKGLENGFALPVLSSAINYFLGYITAESPANLIQAQRDYFGAHTYQRKDMTSGENFHADWKS